MADSAEVESTPLNRLASAIILWATLGYISSADKEDAENHLKQIDEQMQRMEKELARNREELVERSSSDECTMESEDEDGYVKCSERASRDGYDGGQAALGENTDGDEEQSPFVEQSDLERVNSARATHDKILSTITSLLSLFSTDFLQAKKELRRQWLEWMNLKQYPALRKRGKKVRDCYHGTLLVVKSTVDHEKKEEYMRGRLGKDLKGCWKHDGNLDVLFDHINMAAAYYDEFLLEMPQVDGHSLDVSYPSLVEEHVKLPLLKNNTLYVYSPLMSGIYLQSLLSSTDPNATVHGVGKFFICSFSTAELAGIVLSALTGFAYGGCQMDARERQ